MTQVNLIPSLTFEQKIPKNVINLGGSEQIYTYIDVLGMSVTQRHLNYLNCSYLLVYLSDMTRKYIAVPQRKESLIASCFRFHDRGLPMRLPLRLAFGCASFQFVSKAFYDYHWLSGEVATGINTYFVHCKCILLMFS